MGTTAPAVTQYPSVIVLAKYAHITDAEIAADIRDTEREVAAYEKRALASEELAAIWRGRPELVVETRLTAFQVQADRDRVAHRLAFIAFLKRLQAARAAVAVIER